MHAVLCRKWKNRVKGRDWYDLVWYAANHPQLHLAHLEQRMRQSSDWEEKEPLAPEDFRKLLIRSIDALDVNLARKEVEPFIKNPQNLTIWSHEFFYDVVSRIQPT